MFVFLAQIRRRLMSWRTGIPAAAVMLAVFVTSWPLMAVAEPAGSAIVQPQNYWWWFIVSGSTVGYGDLTPETTAGKVVGIYVIIGAITALTTLLTQLATALENAKGRRMQGAITTDATEHIVVLGYTAGRTERILRGVQAETGRRIVLCSWEDTGQHPMPEHDIEFVRGDLTDPEVLQRAGVHRANSVLVDARDDNEALAMALSVNHVNSDAHLVVTLRDLSRADQMKYVNQSLRCVQWHMPRMATEELQDPGLTQVYTDLMTVAGDGNTYSVALPDEIAPVPFEQCQVALGRHHGCTIVAARMNGELIISPGWDATLEPGTMLYYVGRKRLSSDQVASALRGGVSDRAGRH